MSHRIEQYVEEMRMKGVSPAAIKVLTHVFGSHLDDEWLMSSDNLNGQFRLAQKISEFEAIATTMTPEVAAEKLGLNGPEFTIEKLKELESDKPNQKRGGTIRLTGAVTAKVPIPRSMVPEDMLPDYIPGGPASKSARKPAMERLKVGESTLIPRDQMVPVTYEGVCGRRHPGINGGEGLKFSFPEWAPRMLCMPGYGHTPDTSENTCRFVATMAKRHIKDLLRMRLWDCQFCGDRVTTFNLVAISFLAPDVDTISPVRRSVWSYCVPICRSAGYCDQKGARLAGEFRRAHLSGSIITSSGCCMRCNRTADITLCKGCKMVP